MMSDTLISNMKLLEDFIVHIALADEFGNTDSGRVEKYPVEIADYLEMLIYGKSTWLKKY